MTTLLARVQVSGGTAGNGHFTCRGISPPDQASPTAPGGPALPLPWGRLWGYSRSVSSTARGMGP